MPMLPLVAFSLMVASWSAAPAADPCAEYGFCPQALIDPGTGSWVAVPTAEVQTVCKLDPELLREVRPPDGASFAVIRYGRLCFVSGEDGSHGPEVGHLFSVTKTLGAVLAGAVMYDTREIPESDQPMRGPFREFDRIDKWLDLATLPPAAEINPDATVAHVLAMVGYSDDLAHGAKSHRYDTRGDREINYLIQAIDNVVAQDPERFGASAVEVKDRLFGKLGMEHSTWNAGIIGYTWNGSLLDMGRLGLLILNGGIYNGERLLDTEFVYNMTHPAFEDGSTRYGYLTWLNSTTCAPRAIHSSYPHGISQATDCELGDCDQVYDIGVWSANGAQGQFIIGHRGLDLIVVGRNWRQSGANPLWQAVLPAIVAADPAYAGDREAFCEAYGSGSYAPDLRKWEGNR